MPLLCSHCSSCWSGAAGGRLLGRETGNPAGRGVQAGQGKSQPLEWGVWPGHCCWGCLWRLLPQLLQLAIYLVFKWKTNFLCKLCTLSAGRKKVILITRGDISTSVCSIKSGNHSKKGNGASCITLFSPSSPLLHFPIILTWGTVLQCRRSWVSMLLVHPQDRTDFQGETQFVLSAGLGCAKQTVCAYVIQEVIMDLLHMERKPRLQRLLKLWLFLISCLTLWPPVLEA